jgi:hypothetical protein
LSRATMRAHRGSSATDGVVGRGVLVGVAVIIVTFLLCGTTSMLPSFLFEHTPILAVD